MYALLSSEVVKELLESTEWYLWRTKSSGENCTVRSSCTPLSSSPKAVEMAHSQDFCYLHIKAVLKTSLLGPNSKLSFLSFITQQSGVKACLDITGVFNTYSRKGESIPSTTSVMVSLCFPQSWEYRHYRLYEFFVYYIPVPYRMNTLFSVRVNRCCQK